MNQYPSRERIKMSSIICTTLQKNWLLRSASQFYHSKALQAIYQIVQIKICFDLSKAILYDFY